MACCLSMWLKSFFISAYIAGCFLLAVFALYLSNSHLPLYAIIASLLTALVFPVFILKLYITHTPRTPRFIAWIIVVPILALLTCAYSYVDTGYAAWEPLAISIITVLGNFIYLFWYSIITRKVPFALKKGRLLPDFELQTLFNAPFPSSKMRKHASLILFFRGDWCPICSSQIDELAQRYRELQKRNIHVYMVSSQPSIRTAKLAQKFDAPMVFLHDPQNTVAKQLGINIAGGTPLGLQVFGFESDTAAPTVILSDSNGLVFYSDVTDNYRIRPLPNEFLSAFDAHMQETTLHTNLHKPA